MTTQIPVITYTVWPLHRKGEWDDLNREAAVLKYGETTIAAMEAILILNPCKTVALHGKDEELLIENFPLPEKEEPE